MQIRSFMAEQPAAIIETFNAARRFLAGHDLAGIGQVILIGSGSSLNANVVAAPLFSGSHSPAVEVVAPAGFLARRPLANAQRTLVVVLSQSGASTTSIAAAQKASAEGAGVLVITANPASGAARLDLPTVLMPIGSEPIGPKTKGYAASYAALSALAVEFGGQSSDPAGLRDTFETALKQAEARAQTLAGDLDQLDHIMVAGDGASYGTALEGSLKIAEIAGVPTAAYTIEEMLHGRLHGLTQRSLCLPIVSDVLTRRQARRVKEVLEPHGIRVEIVEAASTEAMPGHWQTIASTFLFQHLAVELCVRRGRQPDLMRYPGLTQKLDIKTDVQL